MEILKILTEKKALHADEIASFIKEVERGKVSALQQAAILSGWNVKGITAKELALFVQALGNKREPLSLVAGVHLIEGAANFASSAFIVSGIGLPAVHHISYPGRRDKETALSPDGEKNKKIFEQLRVSFSPPQKLSPALAKLKMVGQHMGVRTIAELATLLVQTSPVHLSMTQVSSKEDVLLLVEAAKILKIKHLVALFTSEDAPPKIFAAELRSGKIKTFHFSEKSFGTRFEQSHEVLRNISQSFVQKKTDPWHAAFSSLALMFSGHFSSLKKAYHHADKFVLSGNASDHFLAYKSAVNMPAFFLEVLEAKRREVLKKKKNLSLKKLIKNAKASDRDFKKSLLSRRGAVITEINPAAVKSSAKFLEQGGAQAIAMATDEKFLNGSWRHLTKTRNLIKEIPFLCRDFIVDEYQLYEARIHGADAVVFMLSLLKRNQIWHFLKIAKDLRMTAVCEIRSDDDLAMALGNEAEVISIHTSNIQQASRWIKKIPQETIVIFEALSSSALKRISGKVDAILVGPKVLKMKDLSKNIERLVGKPKPLIKMCGIRSLEQAVYCQKLGVDLIGLNFVPSSHRRISYQLGQQIIQKIRQDKKSAIKIVGVFQDQDLSEVNTAAEKLDLDYIQLSGGELISYMKKCQRPVIKEVSIVRTSSLNTAAKYASASKYISLDWSRAGVDYRLLKKCAYPYFLGGNITDRIRDIQKNLRPLGLNISSSIETEGEIDLKKIRKILRK